MNTDRELLELAAKAAGAQPYDWDTSGDGLFIRDGKPVILAGGDHDGDWNPLTDDGDAFRLLIALQRNGRVICLSVGRDRSACEFNYVCGDDVANNTRRAIVIAAAEIAKAAP